MHSFNAKCVKLSDMLKKKKIEVKVPKKVVYKVKELTQDQVDPAEATDEGIRAMKKVESQLEQVDPNTKTEIDHDEETDPEEPTDSTETEDVTNEAKLSMKEADVDSGEAAQPVEKETETEEELPRKKTSVHESNSTRAENDLESEDSEAKAESEAESSAESEAEA
jgi:hypothetical protein